jgi:hypothetical protein
MKGYFVEQLRELGPDVLVVRTLFSGDIVTEWLPALVAVDSVLYDERNGVEFMSARVQWGSNVDVYSSSGGGFAAEWSLLCRSDHGLLLE